MRCPRSRPAATPANATWPIPSPIRLMRRCTRKKPTAGASTPDHGPGREREPHELRVKHDVRRVVPHARQIGRRAVEDDRCRGRAAGARRGARPRRTRARRKGSSSPSSSCRRASSAARFSCACTSTPAVGSSRTSSDGSAASAFAMNARCCWPPESVCMDESARRRQADARDRFVDDRPVAPAQRAEQPADCEPAGRDDLSNGRRRLGSEPAFAAPGSRACDAGRSRPPARRTAAPRPLSGRSRPSTSRTSVVLPPPFGPATATNSPCSIRRSTSRSTGGPCPYANETLRSSTASCIRAPSVARRDSRA